MKFYPTLNLHLLSIICKKTPSIPYDIHNYFFVFFLRIVRNKAAERAKVNYTSSQQQQQQSSESPVSQSSGGSGGGGGSSNNVMSGGGSQQQQPPQQGAGGQPPPPPLVSGGPPPPPPMNPHDTSLLRPSYSINGILGIPQPDANANINKRKRDEDGEWCPRMILVLCKNRIAYF